MGETRKKGKYCFVLLPGEEMEQRVKFLRNSLENFIEIPKSPPHITLRESVYSRKIEECIDEVYKSIKSINPFEVELEGFNIFDNKYFVLKANKKRKLVNLHEIIMGKTQNFVDSFRPYKLIGKIDENQKILLKKFNNPFSFEYYFPHLTIGKIENENYLEFFNEFSENSKFSDSFVAKEVFVIDSRKNKIYDSLKFGKN